MTINQPALDFLATRRSRPAKMLQSPVPTQAELEPLLKIAARSPDHGKLEPWRFIVLGAPALRRLGIEARKLAETAPDGPENTDPDKVAFQYETGGLAVAVIHSPVEHVNIPQVEQYYSAGAVCLALLNAALAAGWGANWLSGWASHHPQFRARVWGLEPQERIAGLIHIGTCAQVPPERPRPDMAAKTTWLLD